MFFQNMDGIRVDEIFNGDETELFYKRTLSKYSK